MIYFVKCIKETLERNSLTDVPVFGFLNGGRDGESPIGWPDCSCDVTLSSGGEGHFFRSLFSQFSRFIIDPEISFEDHHKNEDNSKVIYTLVHQMLETIVSLSDPRSGESVGLDNIGTGAEIFLVDGLNDFGSSQGQEVVVA